MSQFIKIHKSYRFWLLIIPPLISFFLFQSSLNYYFFQDDFFNLRISKAENFINLINFFKFNNDIVGYRPITLQTYFFSLSSLFGLNPFAFRIINYIFFIASFFLIIEVSKKIFRNKLISIISASLWILSSIHFTAITWISAAWTIIGTFFWLLTSLLFLKFLEKKGIIFYSLSLIVFLITIGSFEFSVTWPVIFGFYYFLVLGNSLMKSLKILAPFILVSFIYIILRLFFIKIPQITEYQLSFNQELIKALLWYFLWTFNIPEEFKKQVVNNLIVFNSKFL